MICWLNPHTECVVWLRDDGTTEDRPVVYYDGTWIDRDGYEYTFQNTNTDFWDKQYPKLKKVAVQARDENGELVYWKDGTRKMEFKYVPEEQADAIVNAMRQIGMEVDVE